MIWIVIGAIKGAIIAAVLFGWLMDGFDDGIQMMYILFLGALVGATWPYWIDTLVSVGVITLVLGSIVLTFLGLSYIANKIDL